MARTAKQQQFVVCVRNNGCLASIEKRKIYVALLDTKAEEHGFVRIIDESGGDYLYPKGLFLAIDLPRAVQNAVLKAGG